MDIGEDGRIGVSDEARLARHDGIYWGLMCEINMRQLHQSAFSPLLNRVQKYLGSPNGVRMFKNARRVSSHALIKFSEARYVERMVDNGEFRIAPAKYYKDEAPEDAMRDDETTRLYKIKALLDVLDGNTTVEVGGNTVPIKNGFVEIVTPVENYYMFCTCTYFSRRMPTDFKSNAALVIENQAAFLKRLKDAATKQLPNFKFIEDEVTYFDPYNDLPNVMIPEFMKHFAYAYQKEHRCVWRSPQGTDSTKLEPIFLSLGPLRDIARPVYV